MIKLHTPRLLIRDHQLDDLHSYHALLSDPASIYLHSEASTSLAYSQAKLQQSIDEASSENRKLYFLRIENRLTGEHVGEIGYTVTQTTPLGKLAGIGYFLHKCQWGHGYATEAMREVLRFAFEENGVYRLAAGCLKENLASQRVLEKCGFIKEAEFKQYQWHGGALKDRVTYRLLLTEWAPNS